MQYHRGPKSPKFETLQTRTHNSKFYKMWYSTNAASLNMPEFMKLQTILISDTYGIQYTYYPLPTARDSNSSAVGMTTLL